MRNEWRNVCSFIGFPIPPLCIHLLLEGCHSLVRSFGFLPLDSENSCTSSSTYVCKNALESTYTLDSLFSHQDYFFNQSLNYIRPFYPIANITVIPSAHLLPMLTSSRSSINWRTRHPSVSQWRNIPHQLTKLALGQNMQLIIAALLTLKRIGTCPASRTVQPQPQEFGPADGCANRNSLR